MKNKEFAKELERRTRKFAVSIIRLSTTLPNTSEAKGPGELLTIFTSIGNKAKADH
jgi:hypothetical protein